MKGITLALKNSVARRDIPAGVLAAADWHYSRACEAYQDYLVKCDLAEREQKHQRYLDKMAKADEVLRVYQRHTIIADRLLH